MTITLKNILISETMSQEGVDEGVRRIMVIEIPTTRKRVEEAIMMEDITKEKRDTIMTTMST